MVKSILDLGWSPAGFARRLERRYIIQDRQTGRFRYFGDLLAQSPPQQRFYKTIIDLMRRGGPVRLIVLKSRKPGISTATGVLFYDVVTHCEGVSAAVMAHKQESTDYLFGMIDNLWLRTTPELRPQKEVANATTIKFGARYSEDRNSGQLGLQSWYSCSTAGGHNPLTGGTHRLLHWSEVGKTQGGKERQSEIATSAMNSLADPSVVVWESTAQGTGDIFHETWKQAEKNVRNGRVPESGEWVPFFIGAHEDPLNVREVEPSYSWATWPEEDRRKESVIRETLKASDQFLRWRRWKIQEMRMDFDKFDEDYPCLPEWAFLASGRPAVPRHMLERSHRHLNTSPRVYATRLREVPPHEGFGSDAVVGW